ncbi:MAG: hypothetical protein M3Q51_03355 [Pseudomonadota bacterium]|nr:hypothetical protein [Pseudomonadota bacterium]
MLAAGLLCVVATAWAQHPQMQPLKVNPTGLQPIAGAQQLEVQAPNLQLNTAEAQMKREMAELRRENDKLKAEYAQCGQRIANFTVLGGSEVHAYCSAETTSKNTAGASSDCGRYDCEPVTGQCRTQCNVSDQCGTGYGCDSDQRCKTAAEIQANNEG